MPIRILFDEQRARYGRYAGDPIEKQLAHHFCLEAAVGRLIVQMRDAHNRDNVSENRISYPPELSSGTAAAR